MKKEDLKETRQYKLLAKNHKAGVFVPLAWCTRFGITPTELMIFCYIRHHSENYLHKAYTGSVKGLSVIVGSSLPTARKALENLEEKGFITKGSMPRNIGRPSADWVCYTSTIPSDMGCANPGIEKKLESHSAAYEALKEIREAERKKRGRQKKRARELTQATLI